MSRDDDGRVVVATRGGRGAYVCPCPPCVEGVLQKGRLERALRGPVPARDTLRTSLLCRLS